MYSKRTRFLPCWSFVSFGIWRNVWGRVRDWNKSSRKGRTGKKKVAEYIRTHITCIELCVTCCKAKPSSCWKSKFKRMTYWKSRVYIANPSYVIDPNTVYFAWTKKIKGADVVESINHVTFLTKGSRDLLVYRCPPSCFGNKWIRILFSRILCITAI